MYILYMKIEKLKRLAYVKSKDYERDIDDQGVFCCRQLAKLRIVRGICLYVTLLWPVCYNQTDKFVHGCEVMGNS